MLNNPLFNFISQIKQAQNPMAFLNQRMANNPQFQHVMQIVQGKSPQELEQYVRNRARASKFDLEGFFKQTGFNIR